MTITFENDEADVIALLMHQIFQTPAGRRQLQKNRWGFATVAAVSTLFLFSYSMPADPVRAVLISATAAVAGYLLCVGTERQEALHRAKRLVKAGALNDLFDAWEVSAKSDGLQIAWSEGKTVWNWNRIKGSHLTDFHMLLCSSDKPIFSIPKRAFADETQMREFLALIDKFCGAATATPAPVATGIVNSPWWRDRHAVGTQETLEVNLNRRG